MAQKFIGIDLGHHQVKVVVLSRSFRKQEVIASYRANVQSETRVNLETMLDVAFALVEEHGLKGYPAALVLPGDLGSYRVLHFPFSDAKRISQAVVFELDDQFP